MPMSQCGRFLAHVFAGAVFPGANLAFATPDVSQLRASHGLSRFALFQPAAECAREHLGQKTPKYLLRKQKSFTRQFASLSGEIPRGSRV